MVGYVHAKKEDGLQIESVEVKVDFFHEKIEKIHKIYRSHLDANCTD